MSKYLRIISAFFFAAIIYSAINPLSHSNWWLEMLPVFLALPMLIYLGHRYKISNASYTFILIYLLMLVTQAHYGVGFVPIGAKLAPLFGTTRNVFDRITHFFSGLLWFYPLFEMIKQSIGNKKFLNYMIPSAIILALGSIYEIAEWIAFEISGPRIAFLFIGAQDDFYDTPKDMAMSLIGVVIAIIITLILKNIFSITISRKRVQAEK